MQIKELLPLSKAELRDKLETARKQLMELQFKRRTGVDKPHLFKQTKKDIARITSLLNAKKD